MGSRKRLALFLLDHHLRRLGEIQREVIGFNGCYDDAIDLTEVGEELLIFEIGVLNHWRSEARRRRRRDTIENDGDEK